ncbi:MAG: hypothetical protein EXS42_01770 [Lacunisphaera sp.]|nr:hypothetical protein [Lacunisphaera sp.]
MDAAQKVASEPEVTLAVTDSRFDGGAAPEALPGLALGVISGVGVGLPRRSFAGNPTFMTGFPVSQSCIYHAYHYTKQQYGVFLRSDWLSNALDMTI